MTQSVFKVRTLESIYEEIRTVYLDDARPWILGFSGGKDSTCMVQLVWNALSKLPAEKLEKKIYIVSSDTLVESPQIVERITSSLDKLEKASKKSHIPISTNLLRPPVSDTFWVRIWELGYPAKLRCLDGARICLRLQTLIDSSEKECQNTGRLLYLLGTRKSESFTRRSSAAVPSIHDCFQVFVCRLPYMSSIQIVRCRRRAW